MKIGELAKLAGCTVEVVRFYESERILPPPQRQENGYRFYQNDHLQRLAFAPLPRLGHVAERHCAATGICR